jgi:hypothetical protein
VVGYIGAQAFVESIAQPVERTMMEELQDRLELLQKQLAEMRGYL